MSVPADRFRIFIDKLEAEGHHLLDEARRLYEDFVGHGHDTPAPTEPAEPAEPPAAA